MIKVNARHVEACRSGLAVVGSTEPSLRDFLSPIQERLRTFEAAIRNAFGPLRSVVAGPRSTISHSSGQQQPTRQHFFTGIPASTRRSITRARPTPT